MKKLIGTAMLAALLATSAFAEINFGAWLRVLAAPVAGNGEDIVSGMTNSWGYGARPARLNIDATSEDEKIGFSMGVYNDAWDGLSAGDNYVIWAKPWDFLKVSFGKWDYTAFRGDFCFGSWNWIRPNNWLFDDEGLTFDQLGNQNGIQLELTPIEGLLVMWNLPLDKGFNDAYKMFEGQHIAAKYTIGDIGTIKAGWGGKGTRKSVAGTDTSEFINVGSIDGTDIWVGLDADGNIKVKDVTPASHTDDKYLGDINVAFDLTAVENLYLTVGAKISIAADDYKGDDFKFLKVAAGASYQILDNLKLSANFGVQTYKKNDPDFQFGVGVDVGLTDALALAADFRGLIPGDSNTDPTFSFLVGLQYSISSNGYVGIGFQGSTNSNGLLKGDNNSGLVAAKEDAFCWAVPLVISCWF